MDIGAKVAFVCGAAGLGRHMRRFYYELAGA